VTENHDGNIRNERGNGQPSDPSPSAVIPERNKVTGKVNIKVVERGKLRN
jgi:hypothetical protein